MKACETRSETRHIAFFNMLRHDVNKSLIVVILKSGFFSVRGRPTGAPLVVMVLKC